MNNPVSNEPYKPSPYYSISRIAAFQGFGVEGLLLSVFSAEALRPVFYCFARAHFVGFVVEEGDGLGGGIKEIAVYDLSLIHI